MPKAELHLLDTKPLARDATAMEVAFLKLFQSLSGRDATEEEITALRARIQADLKRDTP
jgi:hypothetical protein